MKLGIQNFRTFKDYTEFEIRPLTILIGPNNSGKSSFTKFLLLLRNGMEKLDFSNRNETDLLSYPTSLNWESDSDELMMKVSTKNYPIISKTNIELVFFKDGDLKELSLIEGIIKLEPYRNKVFDLSTMKTLEGKYNYDDNAFDYKIDLQGLLNHIQEDLEKYLSKKKTKINLYSQSDVEYELNNRIRNERDIDADYLYESLLMYASLYHELKSYETTGYLLYDLFLNGKNITNSYSNDIHKIQNECYESKNRIEIDRYSYWQIRNLLTDNLYAIDLKTKNVLKEKLTDLIHADFDKIDTFNIVIKNNELGNKLLNNNKFYLYDIEKTTSFLKYFIYNLQRSLTTFKHIRYIPVNRGNQQRIYHNKEAKKVHKKFIPIEAVLNTDDEINAYNDKIKKILGIEGEIIIENFENSVSAIYVKNGDSKQNLADFGYGFSKLVPILIEINNGINEFIDYIIIEEPEANLHPSLQSKLADIFVETRKLFPSLKIIIETHSEYLIRKLQILTAAGELKTEDCIIHYFNADENVSQAEPKVKPIEITKEGNLTDNFGPGFYDEVTKLQFDLMRIRKEQKN